MTTKKLTKKDRILSAIITKDGKQSLVKLQKFCKRHPEYARDAMFLVSSTSDSAILDYLAGSKYPSVRWKVISNPNISLITLDYMKSDRNKSIAAKAASVVFFRAASLQKISLKKDSIEDENYIEELDADDTIERYMSEQILSTHSSDGRVVVDATTLESNSTETVSIPFCQTLENTSIIKEEVATPEVQGMTTFDKMFLAMFVFIVTAFITYCIIQLS